jgi:hypothetical protein
MGLSGVYVSSVDVRGHVSETLTDSCACEFGIWVSGYVSISVDPP